MIYKIHHTQLYQLYCQFCKANRLIPLRKNQVLWFYARLFKIKYQEFWGLKSIGPLDPGG